MYYADVMFRNLPVTVHYELDGGFYPESDAGPEEGPETIIENVIAGGRSIMANLSPGHILEITRAVEENESCY